MTFIEFYQSAMNRYADVILFTYWTEEPHMISGWISRPMDCKKLREGIRFSANCKEYRRVGMRIENV